MAFQEKLIDALGSFATTFNSYRYIQAIKHPAIRYESARAGPIKLYH